MARLNAAAIATLKAAGVSPALWDRANYGDGSKWTGDACGCPDDRCKDGFHHYPDQACGCLATLLELFLKGDGMCPDGVLPPVPRPYGGFYVPRKLTAERVDEDALTGVIVFGTHSVARAQPLADELARREAGSGYRAVFSGCGWWRDGFEHGRRSWVVDHERGRAAVLFGHIEETGEVACG